MKKILSIISAAVLTAALIPSAYSDFFDNETYMEDGITYYYEIEGDNAIITGVHYGTEKKEVTFPSEIEGHKVTEIRHAYANERAVVEKIIIPEGVIMVGDFDYSPTVREIVLPEGLEEIINDGFNDCRKLEKVNLPSTLKSICDNCFYNTRVKHLSIPDGVEYIGNYALYDRNLSSLDWDMTAEHIGEHVFNTECKFIRDYKGEFLILNGTQLMRYAGEAEEVRIPDTVQKIDPDTFKDSNAKKIIFPGTMKMIECNTGLALVGVEEIVIEEGVEIIGEYMFRNARDLTKLTLPKSLIAIRTGAFQGVGKLKSIEFPPNLEYIGEGAFRYADLSEGVVTIPASVTEIKKQAFGNSKMEKLTIKGTPKIEWAVFPVTLKKVDAKESVITENWRGFLDSEFKQNFEVKDEKNNFGIDSEGRLSKYLGKDKDVVIPETVKKIGIGAFSETDIESVVIPSSVTEIRGAAFKNCKNLKKVTIKPSNSTLTIMETAFLGCDKIKNIDLPDNVKISTGVLSLKKDGVEVTPPPGKLKFTLGEEEPTKTETPEATDKPKATATPKATAKPAASPEPKKLEVKGGDEIKISVDGKTVEFDAQPFIDGNNRTLVPVRAVSEMLNAKVDWDGANQTVTITQDGKIITIVIGSDTMTVDGNNIKMDTQAVISEERTYIPIRFAAEALGLTVDWIE